jgi:hypothetical protein
MYDSDGQHIMVDTNFSSSIGTSNLPNFKKLLTEKGQSENEPRQKKSKI